MKIFTNDIILNINLFIKIKYINKKYIYKLILFFANIRIYILVF